MAWATAYAARSFVATASNAKQGSRGAVELFNPHFVYSGVQHALNGYCDGTEGSSVTDGLNFLAAVGAVTNEEDHSTFSSCALPPTEHLMDLAAKRRIRGFTVLGEVLSFNARSIVNQIEDGRPVILTVPANRSLYNYAGGVYRFAGGGYENLHAVIAVGFDEERGAILVQNSWGQDWGEGGYFWVAMDDVPDFVVEAFVINDAAALPEQSSNSSYSELRAKYLKFLDAAQDGDLPAVRRAIEEGLKGDVAIGGFHAIGEAVNARQHKVVELLLEGGVDPNVGGSYLGNLLESANLNEDAEMMRLLLRYGASPNLLDRKGYSMMCWLGTSDGERLSIIKEAGGICIRPRVSFGSRSLAPDAPNSSATSVPLCDKLNELRDRALKRDWNGFVLRDGFECEDESTSETSQISCSAKVGSENEAEKLYDGLLREVWTCLPDVKLKPVGPTEVGSGRYYGARLSLGYLLPDLSITSHYMKGYSGDRRWVRFKFSADDYSECDGSSSMDC